MATFTNIALNETYELSGINCLEKAWNMSKFVCARMGWNHSMFCNDVTVKLS